MERILRNIPHDLYLSSLSRIRASVRELHLENIMRLIDVQTWIDQARAKDDGSPAFQKGIANLKRLLTILIPENNVATELPKPIQPGNMDSISLGRTSVGAPDNLYCLWDRGTDISIGTNACGYLSNEKPCRILGRKKHTR